MGQRDQGLFALITSTFEKDGIRGFFRGTLPRICLASPAAAVSWGTYETIRLGLQSYGDSHHTAETSGKTQFQRVPSIKPAQFQRVPSNKPDPFQRVPLIKPDPAPMANGPRQQL